MKGKVIMSKLFNIYCDESCHLESPANVPETRFMVIGGIVCHVDQKDKIFKEIKKIKQDNGFKPSFEIKWTKVSKSKLDFYKECIGYFFDCKSLFFRAIIIDKNKLDHKKFNQTHDDFYYKMYWQMLKWFTEEPWHCGQGNKYHIYLDIKDTVGWKKVKKLHEILSKSNNNVNQIKRIQEVRSHEIVIMQITDLLIGAVAYANRYPKGGKSEAKNTIVSLIKNLSKKSLCSSTYPSENKLNLFKWEGKQ